MASTAHATPHFGLETQRPFAPAQNYFQLIGWAFLPASNEPNHVRVVVGEKTLLPVERIDRVDVSASFPAEPAALSSGFKFICYLPFGFYEGTLEISSDGLSWIRVCPLAIPVSSHPILGSIERPTSDQPITQPTRIEGWCFHPEFDVSEIVLQFGNVEVPCEYGLARPDVEQRFPHHLAARGCGFITLENLPRGTGTVKIRARTTCGRVYFIRSEHRVAITSGWIPKRPPPSPVRNLSTAVWTHSPARHDLTEHTAGDRNILFVLYGDFSANSALHVASLANELIDLGYDCVVAVPDHKETVGALAEAKFMAITFDELGSLPSSFKDGRGPLIVHGWTSRENVRKFSLRVAEIYRSFIFVHLEDNEQDILETRLGRPFKELAALTTDELDTLVPEVLSHPHRALDFLRSATGVTIIVDRLREHVPAGRPTAVVWPATDTRLFTPQPRDDHLRAALGFAPSDVVLFYHGNVHTSNDAEVRSLYEAVALLNERGITTHLIRAGRDYPEFLADGDAWIRPFLIHLGHVRPQYLARLMAQADFFVQPGLPDAFNNYRFPSKLPEFFAIGRPVILPATNLGGFLRHGEDAWVLPSADAASIADSIAALHRDPALTEKLSRGALAFAASHFSWAKSAQTLLGFYRSLTPLGAPSSS